MSILIFITLKVYSLLLLCEVFFLLTNTNNTIVVKVTTLFISKSYKQYHCGKSNHTVHF